MIGLMSLSMCLSVASAQTSATKQKRYELSARASEIDPRVKSHPKINFLLETASGRPADIQNAIVDTSVPQRGKLVIWLMSHNRNLFDRLADYGLHAIQVQYARSWFSICCQDKPVGPHCRGNIRLEAATGQDFSDEVSIPKPDGMMERAYQFVKWLERSNPEGNWGQFLNADRSGLNWEKVIVSVPMVQPPLPALQNMSKSVVSSHCVVRVISIRLGRLCRRQHPQIAFSDFLTFSMVAGKQIIIAAAGNCWE